MKIARFSCLISNSTTYEVIHTEEDARYHSEEYTRISEWIEVEFPPRPPEEIVPEQLARLDKAEEELRAKFAVKLHEIAEQRGRLRALTHQVTE